MIRQVLAGTLIVTCASLSIPSTAAAGETVKLAPAATTLSSAVARAAAVEAKTAQPARLQQAQGQAQAPAPQGGGGLSKGARIGIGAAAVAAAIAVGFAVAKGPDPRPWP
jgi:hypothetical protein